MRARTVLIGCCVVAMSATLAAQTRRAARPAPTPPKKEAPELTCPAPLGTGVTTKRAYCDVLAGRDPAAGILITLPPHQGDVTLTFDLHNRHTYSEEQMREPRSAFSRYTASIGALTMDNTLISRAVVQSEFRKVTDLFERIGGGAGPGGLKAVAPTATQTISLTIPAAETRVSILGEKLTVERAEGSATYNATGRPIAIISNVMVEYRPAPPPRAARPPARPAARPPARPPAATTP
jgi:hypothetical protein